MSFWIESIYFNSTEVKLKIKIRLYMSLSKNFKIYSRMISLM